MALSLRHNLLLQVSGLSYFYGSAPALRDLDARFPVGVTGLVGPNGSGKTTLLRVLAGMKSPKRGRMEFCGEPVARARQRSKHRASIGYMPQEPDWIGEFTVRELLEYFGYLRCGRNLATRTKIDRTLEKLDLVEQQRTRLGQLSGGQKRRAFLGQAIVHEPPVLILDEPTVGLDPVQRAQLRRYLHAVAKDRIVIISTHLVEDIAHIADSIQVLQEGCGVWHGSPAELAQLGWEAGVSGMSEIERGMLRVLGLEAGSAPT
ncbi:ATP-binding cassette domain-containing protein [Leucobacter triazinivorans]|uniref:ATP-binding cassette domain-containing protein n=1 Tax=Leucobacter triazinivorans TaxID=1784719 RepID=UPI0013EE5A0D|nr:ATP-binding cassette domain-containing protein [Leucobacter triazinivorans]